MCYVLMDVLAAFVLPAQPDKQSPVCHQQIDVLAVFLIWFQLCFMQSYTWKYVT